MSIYDFLNRNLYRNTSVDNLSTADPATIPTVPSVNGGGVYSDELLSGEIDGTISFTGGFIQSKNFVAGTAGWRLSASGTLEAVNATLSGIITASSGTIGGFTIGATTLTGGALILNSANATITGGTLQTDVSPNARVVITGSSIKGYQAGTGNINRITLSNDTLALADSAGDTNITLRSTSWTVGSSTVTLLTTWHGQMVPGTSATHHLGASGQRWNTVYGVTSDMSSDEILKSGRQKTSYGLNTILKLKPEEYVMFGKKRYGFSAQELYKVIPEVVSGIGPDYKNGEAGINYTDLIAPMVSAIQELTARVEILEKV